MTNGKRTMDNWGETGSSPIRGGGAGGGQATFCPPGRERLPGGGAHFEAVHDGSP